MPKDEEDVSEVLRSTLEAYHIQRFRESCISKLLDSSVDPNIKEEILKHVSEMKESVALILLMVRDSIEIGKDEFKVMNKEAATYAVQQGTDFDGSSGSSSHRDDHDNVEDRSVESARSSSSKQDSPSPKSQQRPPVADNSSKKQKPKAKKKRTKANNSTQQQSKRSKTGSGSTNRVVSLDRDKLLADSRDVIRDLPQQISSHQVAAVYLRLAEVLISQVKHAFDSRDLSSIPSLTRNLIIIKKVESRIKKAIRVGGGLLNEEEEAVDIDIYDDLDVDTSSVGSMASGLNSAMSMREKSLNRSRRPTSVLVSLAQVKDAIHRLKTGEQTKSSASDLSRRDILSMKPLVKFEESMGNLLRNLLNLCLILSVERQASMHDLLTFKKTRSTTEEQLARDAENVDLVEKLSCIVNPDIEFVAKETSMIEFRQSVVLSALASTSKETVELGIKVNRLMYTLPTDTKRKGRKETFNPYYDKAHCENLNGVVVEGNNLPSASKKQTELRRRMGVLLCNLSAHTNIERLLPDSIVPQGFAHKLLINAPSYIENVCNFGLEFYEVDGVLDEKSAVIKKMEDKLKDYDVGERILFADNESQVESLSQLLK
jgi:hypothetical protein